MSLDDKGCPMNDTYHRQKVAFYERCPQILSKCISYTRSEIQEIISFLNSIEETSDSTVRRRLMKEHPNGYNLARKFYVVKAYLNDGGKKELVQKLFRKNIPTKYKHKGTQFVHMKTYLML